MPKRAIRDRILRFFKALYLKLFRINDTPQKIAIGLGIGVFFGMLPGTGPVAALFLAFVLRVNRAAALLGSVLTNTWLSIPVFLLAIKSGAVLTGLHYRDIQAQWDIFLHGFHWNQLLSMSAYTIIGPILVGYLVISFCVGVLSYIMALVAITYYKRKKPVV